MKVTHIGLISSLRSSIHHLSTTVRALQREVAALRNQLGQTPIPEPEPVGILAAGIMFFVRERRSFITKSGERLETVEKRINELETKVTTGNDKMVNILGQQLEVLHEMKDGQKEIFTRMWNIMLRALNGTITKGSHHDVPNQPAPDEVNVL